LLGAVDFGGAFGDPAACQLACLSLRPVRRFRLPIGAQRAQVASGGAAYVVWTGVGTVLMGVVLFGESLDRYPSPSPLAIAS
jgi:hypothetical protein